MESIGIVGLGWLGKATAFALQDVGHQVVGTVTSAKKKKELDKKGLTVYLFKLGEKLPEALKNCDTLLITIPPRGDQFVECLSKLVNELTNSTQVIFVSSTSVYPNSNTIAKEEDAVDRISPHSGISLLKAESTFSQSKLDYVILRFAGLMGPRRHPGKFLAGRENVSGSESPVNMVHLDDCIGIIRSIISQKVKKQILNICSDLHPTRKEFYMKAALSINLDPPKFNSSPSNFKIVDNTLSKSVLKYTYKYPDPLEALDSI